MVPRLRHRLDLSDQASHLRVELPQTDVRICPAWQRLRSASVEERLTLPDDPEMGRHTANAVHRHIRRGWRLEMPDRNSPIDGMVSLAMALDRLVQARSRSG